jgi:hypothetical protein
MVGHRSINGGPPVRGDETNKGYWSVILTGVLLTGCLHSYHDYLFEQDTHSIPGLRLRVGARLHDRYGAFDGVPADSSTLSWHITYEVGLDDSLRESAYVIVDSLHLVPAGRPDTIECNSPTVLKYPGSLSASWQYHRIPFSALNADTVTLSMIVWLVSRDERQRSRNEVSWTGRLKRIRVHSDY